MLNSFLLVLKIIIQHSRNGSLLHHLWIFLPFVLIQFGEYAILKSQFYWMRFSFLEKWTAWILYKLSKNLVKSAFCFLVINTKWSDRKIDKFKLTIKWGKKSGRNIYKICCAANFADLLILKIYKQNSDHFINKV